MTKPVGSIKSTWRIRTYDVWGNARDGYEVNDVCPGGSIDLCIPQTRHNIGTPQEFLSASPSNAQLKRVFGVNCHIDTDGDDVHIYINRRRDSYPIGELECESHESLSPVRKREKRNN